MNDHWSELVLFQYEIKQQTACQRYEEITDVARQELKDLKKRRVVAFKRNLTELAELELKHAKVPNEPSGSNEHLGIVNFMNASCIGCFLDNLDPDCWASKF